MDDPPTVNDELRAAFSERCCPVVLLGRLQVTPHAVVPTLVADHIHGFLAPADLCLARTPAVDLGGAVKELYWHDPLGPIGDVLELTPDLVDLHAIQMSVVPRQRSMADSTVASALTTVRNITALHFTDSDCIGAQTCAACGKLPHLETLDLRRCDSVGPAALRSFGRLGAFPALRRLVLAHTGGQVTVATAASLAALPALTDLNLDGHNVNDDVVRALGAMPLLESLDVSYSDRLTDHGLRSLASMRSLTHLRMSGAKRVTDAGIVALAQGCTQLRSLLIADMGQLTDASAAAFSASLPELQTLTFPSGQLTLLGLRCVGSLPRLTNLDVEFQRSFRGRLPVLCAAAPLLTSLEWPKEPTTVSDFASLRQLSKLTELKMDITFTPDHFAVLGALPSLVTLTVNGSRGLTADGLSELRPSKTLRKCNVSCTDIDDDGVAVLQAIPSVQEIRFLNCRGVTAPKKIKSCGWYRNPPEWVARFLEDE